MNAHTLPTGPGYKRPYSDYDNMIFVRMWNAGERQSDIARAIGRSAGSVSDHVETLMAAQMITSRSERPSKSKTVKPLTEFKRDIILAMGDKGYENARICQEADVSALQVCVTLGRALPPGLPQDPAEAHRYHVIDLKRAGHSPQQTELNISRDGNVRHFHRPLQHSPVGSSASSCADSF